MAALVPPVTKGAPYPNSGTNSVNFPLLIDASRMVGACLIGNHPYDCRIRIRGDKTYPTGFDHYRNLENPKLLVPSLRLSPGC